MKYINKVVKENNVMKYTSKADNKNSVHRFKTKSNKDNENYYSVYVKHIIINFTAISY